MITQGNNVINSNNINIAQSEEIKDENTMNLYDKIFNEENNNHNLN